MVKFGERMKAARTAKHMSQQALADTLEVSSDYLLARTDVKRTATFSGVSESDLAARVARIENHLGLN